MAIMQRFRGNPEEKKYVLYNNFSGGINTTDIDEVVLTSQFRVLENVELAQRGAIQNRKGFQIYKPLNDLLTPLNFDHIYLLTPLQDNQNVLESISKSESLEKFLEENPYAFEIMMLVVGAQTEANLQVHAIKMVRDKNSPAVAKSVYPHTLGFQYDRPKRITDIEFVNFNNKLYIALGQLSSDLEGFLEVSINEDGNPNFKRMNRIQGVYLPNAYEISNIGFNNLAAFPLNAVEPSFTGVESIRTFWLTKVNNKEDSFSTENLNTPIYKIPNNTDFILNVLVTGNSDPENLKITPEDLNVDIYTQDLEGEKVFVKPEGRDKIIESTQNGDLIRYRIAVNIEQTKETFIDINKKQFAVPEITETFLNVTGMMDAFTTKANHYRVDSSGKYAEVKIQTSGTYGYMTPTLDGKTIPGGKIWYKFVDSRQGALYWSGMSGGTDTILPPASEYSEGSAMRIGTNTNNYEYYRLDITEAEVIPSMRLDNALVQTPNIMNYPNLEGVWRPVLEGSPSNKSVTRFVKITSTEPVYTSASGDTYSNLSNVVRPEPDLLGLYFTTNDSKYYKWRGTTDGTSEDFEEYDVSEEDIVEFSFVNTFTIGQDLDLQPIKPIDTSNVKMVEHGGRLLIYDKNTMWFSDLYNFNYFPNNNYVILPLRSDDEIMKIAYFRGSYIILTRFSLYRMSGTFGTEEFEVVLINNAIGCTSADSVRNVNNTLVFLTNDGLYLLKQNYFMEGLENVEKIDLQTQGIYPIDRNVESIIYKEQLLFFVKDNNDEYVKTIKQYYNLPIAKNMFPVSVDRYRTGLQGVSKLGTNLVAYKDRKFYIYDRGYSDFMPEDVEEEDRENYFYKITIITPKYNLGYPTHDKKYKNLYVNTRTEKISPLSVTVYVDGYEYINPSQFQATLNRDREIVYTQITNNNIEMRHAALGMNPSEDFVEYHVLYDEYGQITGLKSDVLEEEFLKPVYNVNDFEVGVDKMGVQEMQTHKLVVSGKGKTISFKIEHLVDEMIVVHNLGILHKLGKVKEG